MKWVIIFALDPVYILKLKVLYGDGYNRLRSAQGTLCLGSGNNFLCETIAFHLNLQSPHFKYRANLLELVLDIDQS